MPDRAYAGSTASESGDIGEGPPAAPDDGEAYFVTVENEDGELETIRVRRLYDFLPEITSIFDRWLPETKISRPTPVSWPTCTGMFWNIMIM